MHLCLGHEHTLGKTRKVVNEVNVLKNKYKEFVIP